MRIQKHNKLGEWQTLAEAKGRLIICDTEIAILAMEDNGNEFRVTLTKDEIGNLKARS